MSTVPAAIAILSQLLKDAGHVTSIFDTTFYKLTLRIHQFIEAIGYMARFADPAGR